MKSRRNESLPIFPGRPSVQGEEFIGSLDDCPIYSPTSSRGAGVRVESKRKSAIYFLRQCGRGSTQPVNFNGLEKGGDPKGI
jgi:hypothetical protein